MNVGEGDRTTEQGERSGMWWVSALNPLIQTGILKLELLASSYLKFISWN
jgi:hypothetical protein